MAGLDKRVVDCTTALEGFTDGMTIASGGFSRCGMPGKFVAAVQRRGISNLAVISNFCGVGDFGLRLLPKTRQTRRVIASYIRENVQFERQLRAGQAPRHSSRRPALAPRLGKARRRAFNGLQHIVEHSLRADFQIVRGCKADWFGSVIYRSMASNFNPAVATAGPITVVEVEEVVPPGTLDPNYVHTPDFHVDRLIQGRFEKRIKNRD